MVGIVEVLVLEFVMLAFVEVVIPGLIVTTSPGFRAQRDNFAMQDRPMRQANVLVVQRCCDRVQPPLAKSRARITLSASLMKPDTSNHPQLIAIAAMASNRVIGRDGKLPWHLPEDLKFFKQTTLGKPVLMGRKTFDSIVERLGKPLPGRLNIVLSKTMPERDDARVIRDIADIQSSISDIPSPIYLIGGAQLYETLLPNCHELLLTCIDAPFEGDTFFPPFDDMFKLKEVLVSGDGYQIRRFVKRA